MSFYSEMADTAKELIAEFGRNVTLRTNNPGTYSAASDTYSGATVTDVTVKAVFTEFKQSEIDGTLIVRGDKKVLFAASAEPNHNDIIIDGADQYRVIEIMEVQPGDTMLLYKVQVRK